MIQYPRFYPQQQPQQSPQFTNVVSEVIGVQSEEEARAWAVTLGNSVMFKNENEPYFYTKTMGFSPLEQPKFEKFRLVKEAEPTQEQAQENSELAAMREEIASLKKRLRRLEVEEEDEEE